MKSILYLALALICVICWPVWISDTTLAFSNSILSVAVFAALLWILCLDARTTSDRRLKRYTLTLGLLFSLMTAFGHAIEQFGRVPYESGRFWFAILVFSWVFSAVLRLVWQGVFSVEAQLEGGKCLPGWMNAVCRRMFARMWLPAAVLLMCWLPCYLAVFPGNFVYDATEEYYQITYGYDGDFPMLHSALIVRILAYARALTGSYNVGIAIYTIVQMVLLALMFAYILRWFFCEDMHPALLLAGLVYYALFPVIAMLTTCTVRDVLFSALLVLTIFLLYQLRRNPTAFFASKFRAALLGIVLVTTCYARNNNAGMLFGVLLALAGLMIICLAGKRNRHGAMIFLSTAVSCCVVLSVSLSILCRPMNPPTGGAAISLLTQSINRAYTQKKENWTEQEKETFHAFFEDADHIYYNPVNGDSTKFNYLGEEEDLGRFLRFWAQIGRKYPACYADAILANTSQMWFPDSVVDGYSYSDPEFMRRYEKSYFNLEEIIDSPGEHVGLLPGVLAFYNAIAQKISFEKIPVISMLFSIGFQFWVLLNAWFMARYRKARAVGLALGLLLLYMICSAFTPLVLLRYYAAVFFAVPVILILTIQMKKSMA